MLVKSIHPKKRDQDSKSILEKAGDTAITTVDVGPWMYNHREAGESSFISLHGGADGVVVKPMLDRFAKGIRDDPVTCALFHLFQRQMLIVSGARLAQSASVGVHDT